MELIIEDIVEEVCYLVSAGYLQEDIYLDDLLESLFNYGKSQK
jgi:hypothetical protein